MIHTHIDARFTPLTALRFERDQVWELVGFYLHHVDATVSGLNWV
jgi:hypothetical protein